MPDKIYKKGCGTKCLRCWHMRLKHANPTVKKYMKKHKLDSIHTDEYNVTLLELKLKNLTRDGFIDTDIYNETLLQLKLENQKKVGSIDTTEYKKMLLKLKNDDQKNSSMVDENYDTTKDQKPIKTNTRRLKIY